MTDVSFSPCNRCTTFSRLYKRARNRYQECGFKRESVSLPDEINTGRAVSTRGLQPVDFLHAETEYLVCEIFALRKDWRKMNPEILSCLQQT